MMRLPVIRAEVLTTMVREARKNTLDTKAFGERMRAENPLLMRAIFDTAREQARSRAAA
jgi:hypothetical protein